MSKEPVTAESPTFAVTVRPSSAVNVRAFCTCGWQSYSEPATPLGRDCSIRAGARHLYEAHDIYAGGHYAGSK